MSLPAEVAAFWDAFQASGSEAARPDRPLYEAFSFGSRPESADELSSLVLDGVKTATSELLRVYDEEGRRPPQAEDLSIVLDGSGRPVCVMETTWTAVAPFEQVDAALAYEYGEGERTLEWWLEAMRESYEEECEAHGWEFDPSLPLVFERFRVVWVP